MIYLIAVLAVIHFLWLVKADLLEPLIYGAVLLLLLATRLDSKALCSKAGRVITQLKGGLSAKGDIKAGR